MSETDEAWSCRDCTRQRQLDIQTDSTLPHTRARGGVKCFSFSEGEGGGVNKHFGRKFLVSGSLQNSVRVSVQYLCCGTLWHLELCIPSAQCYLGKRKRRTVLITSTRK